MLVDKTIRRRIETAGKTAQEETQADSPIPEIPETIDHPALDEERDGLYPIFSKINKNFEVLDPVDSS